VDSGQAQNSLQCGGLCLRAFDDISPDLMSGLTNVFTTGELMVSMRVRDRESIQEAVRRFRKLVERSGLKREMRRRQFYEKPSETKRRARLRAERRALSARRALTKTR